MDLNYIYKLLNDLNSYRLSDSLQDCVDCILSYCYCASIIIDAPVGLDNCLKLTTPVPESSEERACYGYVLCNVVMIM